MATNPRNNPAGPYLRYPCFREPDPTEGIPLWVLVKSLVVYRQRLVRNYRCRGGRRSLGRA